MKSRIASTPDFRLVNGEALHYMELEPADDGWPCATLIDIVGHVVHEAPDGCEGLVEYPEKRQGARLLYCTRYCEDVAGLVRRRRRVEKEGRHKRAENGSEVLIALWRQESDLLAATFIDLDSLRASARMCSGLRAGAASSVEHRRRTSTTSSVSAVGTISIICSLSAATVTSGRRRWREACTSAPISPNPPNQASGSGPCCRAGSGRTQTPAASRSSP